MRTQCPQCRTIYRITPQQTEQAEGLVRCGHCHEMFNAFSPLTQPSFHDTTPRVKSTIKSDPNSQIVPVSEADTRGDNHGAIAPIEEIEITALETEVSPVANPTPDLSDNTDDWLIQDDFRISKRWLFGSLAALLVLGIQFIYLANHSLPLGQTAWLRDTCQWLPFCTPQARRALNEIILVQRNVYTHPNEPDSLVFSAQIVNNADFNQPYPTLLISMSDTQGDVVAQRYFAPQDYLGLDSYDSVNLDRMHSGESTFINLEIMDPGKSALAFEVDFF